MAQLKMTISALFCVLCLLVPLTSAKPVDFQDCGLATDIIKIRGVDVFSDSIGSISIVINAITAEAISGGTLTIILKLGVIRILHSDLDLCGITTCPISPGNFTMSVNNLGPPPRATFNFHIEVISEDDEQMACIAFAITGN